MEQLDLSIIDDHGDWQHIPTFRLPNGSSFVEYFLTQRHNVPLFEEARIAQFHICNSDYEVISCKVPSTLLNQKPTKTP